MSVVRAGVAESSSDAATAGEVFLVRDDSPVQSEADGEEILDISVTETSVAQISERIVRCNRRRLLETMREAARDVCDRVRGHPEWNLDDEDSTQARRDSRRIELTIEFLRAACRQALQQVCHSRQYWFQLFRWSAQPLTGLIGSLPPDTPAGLPHPRLLP